MTSKIFLALLPPYGDCGIVPLGIPCVTAGLTMKGYQVSQKDFNADIYYNVIKPNEKLFSDLCILTDEACYDTTIYPLLKPFLSKWAEEIIQTGADIIGFSAFITNLITIYKISELIKALDKNKIIVIGGPEVTRNPLVCSRNSIDFAVKGDGEQTMVDLIEAVESSRRNYNIINGLCFLDKKTKQIVSTNNKMIADIDILPYPDFRGLNFNNYRSQSVPLEASRGCINRCSYCGEAPFMKRYRYKTAKRIFSEVMHFLNRGNNNFSFMDSLINGKIDQLEGFCDLVIKNKINKKERNILWGGNACIRKEMTRKLLKKMSKAGCKYLVYGIESGSNSVLLMMNKRTNIKLMRKVLKYTHSAKIKTYINMIIGFPTETEYNFQETLNFITRNKNHIDLIFAGGGCTIPDNTDLEKHPERYGIYWKKESSGWAWYSKETTPDIRKRRLCAFVELCKKLNINVQSSLLQEYGYGTNKPQRG
jgi:anaerobic magnesium-protoporphyrin IX monomethyl ester cyclase